MTPAQAIAKRDQAWTDLARYQVELSRIYDHGPESEDLSLINKVVAVALGELLFRRANRLLHLVADDDAAALPDRTINLE